MDRQAHEYAVAMAFAQQQQQQQQQAGIQQQQHFGFHQQPHQFAQQVHGPPFMPPHPSMQQFPYHRHLPPQQQLYPPHNHPLHQQPPPSYAPHLPPHLASPPFMHPFESPPPLAMPPSDPELHKRIDKLVEYSAKNGPEFEAMIREKQQDNPDYSFLFGGEGHNYYRYKLWMFTRPPGSAVNPSFPSSSMPTVPPHSPLLNQPALNAPPLGAVPGPPASLLASPPLHQPSYPPYFDQHQQPSYSQPFLGQGRADYDSTRGFKGLSGPLPSDVAVELNSVLGNLTGTKESIKGAKMWFMQRSPFAPALAEALRERIFTLDDSERQLHIIFLANDILFDSLQRRVNPQDLDNEALAFKPVLGSMLCRIYNNPHNKEANQSRLEKILQFWAAKEVYDQSTIASLESEMTGGLPSHSVSQKESVTGQPSSQWQHSEKQNCVLGSANQQDPEKQFPQASLPSHYTPTVTQPFPSNQLPAGIYPPVVPASFPASLPISSAGQLITQPPQVPEQAPPPYPLFPPGLIPGMVRKMQIGSGVPYSPMSPLDIPTIIPPSTVTPSEILDRVAKFFKEIGEVNPSEGPMKATQSNPDHDYEEDVYEREKAVRKGGACIPPPANLQPDPETGMYPDGSVDRKGGSGRLGLGATANPNEVSQYDDVYTSYRKQRSTSYHSSMSARASAR